MKPCWTCGDRAPEVPFCSACGAVQPLVAEGYFELFGLPERHAVDLAQLEKRHRDLHRRLHPDRFALAEPKARRYSLERATALNEAYRTLKDPMRRAEYMLRRRGVVLDDVEAPKAAPEFLMEVLELREGLEEARAAHDLDRVRAMAKQVAARRDEASRDLAEGLDGDVDAGPTALTTTLGRLKYFTRFMDEVEAIEAEAADAAPVDG